jgi:hypothetical protein
MGRFVADSLLEDKGFEPPVPRQGVCHALVAAWKHRRINFAQEAAEVQFDLFFAASHSADAQFRADVGLLTSSAAGMHPVIAAARLCRIIAAPASCRYLSSHTSSIRNPL